MTDTSTEVGRLVDKDALRTYLAAKLGEADEFAVEHHLAGHSNETLFLTWDDRDLVLRRPPAGETAETAHDVAREYRVMSALQETDVPVPPTVHLCEDHSILGSDFYLMDRLDGDVIRTTEPERFAEPGYRRRLGEELVDTLAAIHDVDYEAVGLPEGDFGYPEGYTRRQVDRWGQQLEWSVSKTDREDAIPALYELETWLDENCPEAHEHALVHGDYKLDNVMFGPGTPPELVGVFDWELSTLGDPLADLGWMLLFWHENPDRELVPELVPQFLSREGYLSKRDLVDRYENATGRTFERPSFYRALGAYKLAVLCEMFYARYQTGSSQVPMHDGIQQRTPNLAEHALAVVRGEKPL